MATGNFIACLKLVLRLEGGYADNPKDPGGATNFGITRKTLARWRNISPWWNLPRDEVRALDPSEASAIYRGLYWNTCACPILPGGLDLVVFDFAVNSGPARAIRALQAELDIRVDGIAGPITLQSVRAVAAAGTVKPLISRLSARRLGFLRKLAAFADFGRGWSTRVRTVEIAALAMRPADEASRPPTRRTVVDILSGYKTYIIAVMMAVTALAQLAGVSLPGFDGHSPMQLLMEAFSIMFLRRGIKTDISSAG